MGGTIGGDDSQKTSKRIGFYGPYLDRRGIFRVKAVCRCCIAIDVDATSLGFYPSHSFFGLPNGHPFVLSPTSLSFDALI